MFQGLVENKGKGQNSNNQHIKKTERTKVLAEPEYLSPFQSNNFVAMRESRYLQQEPGVLYPACLYVLQEEVSGRSVGGKVIAQSLRHGTH